MSSSAQEYAKAISISVQKHESLCISQTLTADSIYYIDHLIRKLHDRVDAGSKLAKAFNWLGEDAFDEVAFCNARFDLAELRVCYGAILAHPKLQAWLEEFEQNEWLAKSDVLNALSNATPALEFHDSVIEKLSTYGILLSTIIG